ncbi:hypothetical protein ACHHYP_20675 [Achlya hypogyna]|uniref:Uncharacterized protein n=1 Tax=Achlya hypogyna TaxID=1202772 RepID=A0A1V9YFA9_ACHHY|nr:hypothetical protein ACHHYP_20675 [Achlya hypogyna]
MAALCDQQASRCVICTVLTAGTNASQVDLAQMPGNDLLDKACHVPARAHGTTTLGQLLSNALRRADRPNSSNMHAKLDFFRWAHTMITFVRNEADECHLHIPREQALDIASRNIARMDPGRWHYLWY